MAGEASGLAEVVRRHHHLDAARGGGAHDVFDRFGRGRIETGRRLVEQQQSRIAGQRPGQSQPLLLTAGEAAGRTVLVDHGVAKQYLSDLQTAAALGSRSTGSAHRAIGSMPAPGSSVVLVGPGTTPYSGLIAGMDKGIVVEILLGAGQSNVIGGDFQGNVLLGFAVENGRITGRIKDTLVSGNVYSALSNIAGISKEVEWVRGSVRTPAILCRGVSVSSKS